MKLLTLIRNGGGLEDKEERERETKMNVLPTFLQEFIKSVVKEIVKLADERLSIKRCVKFPYIIFCEMLG